MPHLTIPVSDKDHIQGPSDATVTLVEYGDYQCKLCRLTHSILKQIQKQLDNQLRYVFRHFPLKLSHPLALLAAQAAEAAAKQDKFWEMHDCLYSQRNLSPESILAFADELNLNKILFETDIKDPQIANRIDEDFRSGIRSGVNGTPCFYINGERYDGDRSFDQFLLVLKNENKRP